MASIENLQSDNKKNTGITKPQKKNINIDLNKLQQQLGIPIVAVNPRKDRT